MPHWFEQNPGPMLQGQVLFGHKTYTRIDSGNSEEQIQTREDIINLIILSQSCDLVNGKALNVFVAPIYQLDEILAVERYKIFASPSFQRLVSKGLHPGLCMLGGFQSSERKWDWIVVSFSEIVTIPFESASSLFESNQSRPVLQSPFREYLSQAFARSVMRVGIAEKDQIAIADADDKKEKQAIDYLSGLGKAQAQYLLSQLE